MASHRLTPLILCGGAGTRLWPVSRDEVPKQFIALLGESTSFQETVLRVRDPDLFTPPLIVTNERYAVLVEGQLAEIGAWGTVLIEPLRADSGPAIAAATAFSAKRDPDSTIIVLPSDHVVRDQAAFRSAAARARAGAQEGLIVTFGIEPDHPATGYGYIQLGPVLAGGLRKAARFVEKPDRTTAECYVAEGYLWNAGNFVFRADTLLAEYEAADPDTAIAAREAATRASPGSRGYLLDAKAFARCRAQSLDYAVIEASQRVAVIPVTMGWSDVGSWHAVWELSDKDFSGNVAQGEALFIEARNNFVRSRDSLVCVVGLEGLGVIATSDAILVYDRSNDSSVKKAVAALKAAGNSAVREHPDGKTG